MSDLYPLRFQPIFRRYLWGGRRLQTLLGKPIGQGQDYAESWEVVDHGQDQSHVAAGPLQGLSLKQLLSKYGPALLGPNMADQPFPLLFKFLDANRNLSVQVHPNDQQAALLDPPDLGKTEAWLILHAEPGSVVYAGLKQGIDRAALEREIQRDATHLCLHKIEPQPGDCLFIPAGVVHALGQGLLVAEIQQASDTTFRLFDWNRVDADGQPRQLHIEQGLDVIDYDFGPAQVQTPQTTDQDHIQRLVECDKFILDRWEFNKPTTIGGDGRFHIVTVLKGQLTVAGDPMNKPLGPGETTLLGAELEPVLLTPHSQTMLLDMYLP